MKVKITESQLKVLQENQKAVNLILYHMDHLGHFYGEYFVVNHSVNDLNLDVPWELKDGSYNYKGEDRIQLIWMLKKHFESMGFNAPEIKQAFMQYFGYTEEQMLPEFSELYSK
jgi:hypothetical protein